MIKKDYAYSMARFIAIIMVIFCHIFEYTGYHLGYGVLFERFGNFLSVGVQIFLLLSGILYGSRDSLKERPTEFFLRNCKKVMLDYYVYAFLVIIPVYTFFEPNVILFLKRVFRLGTLSGVISGVHHTWFIPYILFCYVITPYLYDIRDFAKEKLWMALISLFVLFEVIKVAFNLRFTATWINCYILGFFIPKLSENCSKHDKSVLVCLCSIVSIFSLCVRYIVRYHISPLVDGNFLSRICNYVVSSTKSFDGLTILLLIITLYKLWEAKIGTPLGFKSSCT